MGSELGEMSNSPGTREHGKGRKDSGPECVVAKNMTPRIDFTQYLLRWRLSDCMPVATYSIKMERLRRRGLAARAVPVGMEVSASCAVAVG